jgi:hypothetical protein
MANLYTIEDLLIGKSYHSKSISNGKIISAQKSDTWYGREAQGYFVEIDSGSIRNTYRHVAVGSVDEASPVWSENGYGWSN